jgi:hypothetical protein
MLIALQMTPRSIELHNRIYLKNIWDYMLFSTVPFVKEYRLGNIYVANLMEPYRKTTVWAPPLIHSL